MNNDDFFTKSQIESNIRTIIDLINSGIFSAEVLRIFEEPVFVSLILKLNDLLQKFNKLDHRISFKEDISVENIDITELIRRVRNAIVHLDSDENMIGEKAQIKFIFNKVVGKVKAIEINSQAYGGDYQDDTAFFYGEYRVYLKRHIIRLIKESQEVYKKLYNQEFFF